MASRGDFMKVLSKLQAPAIAGVIREKTAKDAIAEIKNCMYDGADNILCRQIFPKQYNGTA